MTAPPDLREFDEKIAAVRLEKESAIDGQDFEKAARLRDDEKKLLGQKAERESQWKSGDMDVVAEVDEELIAEVLAASTGIPVFKLTEEESSRLLHMEDELHKRIVGMDDAIKALSQAIRRTRAGLKDPRRPGGSFIFAGPTGVGKTELAKTLAEFLFGDEDSLIQLDMSEYSEKHTVSRLFGSPPGYVGYEEGGQLTEKVRRKPFSVVLFDEVEKAHPDIFNSLLQVLEDGRLTDSQGRMVDFKNTVIIMTTNLGTRDIAKGVSLGFSAGPDSRSDYERMKNKVVDELKQHFRPEFLNRVDDTIVFPQLTQAEIVAIVDLEIAKLDKRLKDKDMGLELTMEAKALLAKKGYDPVLGARPLRRTIQREIEDVLSEKILYGELKAGEIVLVGTEGEGKAETFTFTGNPHAGSHRPPGRGDGGRRHQRVTGGMPGGPATRHTSPPAREAARDHVVPGRFVFPCFPRPRSGESFEHALHVVDLGQLGHVDLVAELGDDLVAAGPLLLEHHVQGSLVVGRHQPQPEAVRVDAAGGRRAAPAAPGSPCPSWSRGHCGCSPRRAGSGPGAGRPRRGRRATSPCSRSRASARRRCGWPAP